LHYGPTRIRISKDLQAPRDHALRFERRRISILVLGEPDGGRVGHAHFTGWHLLLRHCPSRAGALCSVYRVRLARLAFHARRRSWKGIVLTSVCTRHALAVYALGSCRAGLAPECICLNNLADHTFCVRLKGRARHIVTNLDLFISNGTSMLDVQERDCAAKERSKNHVIAMMAKISGAACY
jgi:hypothetical protein